MRRVRRIALPILGAVCAALLLALAWALGRRSGLEEGKAAAIAQAPTNPPVTRQEQLAYLNEYVRTNQQQLVAETVEEIRRRIEYNAM